MDNGHGGIRLIKVNPVNFDELIDLKVNKSQKGFVAPNRIQGTVLRVDR